MSKIVAVFGSSKVTPADPWYREGEQLGRLLAEAGLTVATGGYSGMMEAVSAGAAAAGGHVLGITAPPVFPHRDRANPHVAEEITADTISERIHRLVTVADATVTMPGSLGTVTEFLVAWNTNFVAPFRGATPHLQVAVGPMWRRLVDHLVAEFGADDSYVTCVDDVDTAARIVIDRLTDRSWHTDRP